MTDAERDNKINELYAFMQNLSQASSVPFSVEGALKERIGKAIGLSLSLKGADTEDVAVNEAGSSSYSVMGDPTGFLEVNIGGIVYYVPYFS